MTERETLVRNTFWYGVVTVVGLVTSMGMSVVLARGLGPARMGDYAYVAWASRTLTALATLGFTVATVRYTARAFAQGETGLARGFLEMVTRWQLLAAAILAALLTPIVLAVAPPSVRWPLVVVCVGLFPVTLEQVYAHAVYGAQRYELAAQAITTKLVLHFAAAVLVLVFDLGILDLVVATTMATILAGAMQRHRVRQLYEAPAQPVPGEMTRELRRFVFPLSVVIVLDAIVWERFEVFFVHLWGAPHDVAFFSLASGLAGKAMVLPEVALGALLPALSSLHVRGATEEFGRVWQRAVRYVALAAVPVAAIGVGLGPSLVRLLFGPEYLPVASLFPVLVVGAVLAAIRRVAWVALRAVGDQWSAVGATIAAALVDICLLTLLIAPLGVWAAAAANLAAQCVATLWVLGVVTRRHHCSFPVMDLVRIVFAGVLGLVATLTVVAMTDPGLVMVTVAAAAGLGTFGLGVIVTRLVGMDEWRTLLRWSGARFAVPSA